MDFLSIVNQLNDLPATFRRPGTPYTWLIDSLATCLYLMCQASDSLQAQYNFLTSTNGWIDVWGDLCGITRNTNESNVVYLPRIQNTVLAWRDSAVAIEKFLNIAENIQAAVLEQNPVGYKLLFPYLTDINRITQAVLDLKYVRPAGVPFTVFSEIGTYLNTVDYYGKLGTTFTIAGNPWSDQFSDQFGPSGTAIINGFTVYVLGALSNIIPTVPVGRVTGQYLAAGQPLTLQIPASTNNVVGIIPSLLFTDPTLNP